MRDEHDSERERMPPVLSCKHAGGDGPCFFFFFQAEDGIRDRDVTGVQTCALPISRWTAPGEAQQAADDARGTVHLARDGRRRGARVGILAGAPERSEERRVGKEGRSRWWREQ